MEFSIVTALFNGHALTQRFVESVDATLQGVSYELIFVDDGSTDETREWLASLKDRPRTTVILNEQNQGFGESNNRGAHAAQGRVLLLLNNDLVLQPGWLDPMRALLGKHFHWDGQSRRCAMVGNVQRRVSDELIDHAGVYIDAASQPQHAYHSELVAPKSPALPWTAVTAACCMIERQTFFDLGAFNPAFRNGMEDIDLCLRVGQAGDCCAVANRSTVLHHVSASRGRKSEQVDTNFEILTKLWRGPLTRASRYESSIHAWRRAGWPERLKQLKTGIHLRTRPKKSIFEDA